MSNVVEIVIDARDQTRAAFASARRGISSLIDSVRGSAGRFAGAFQDVFGGGLKGALSTPYVGPIIMAAVASMAVTLAPLIALLIGGAITLGLGGALVGVGVMLLMQNKKVKADFAKTFGEIKADLTKAFEPLIPVLDTVRKVLKQVSDAFTPVIEKSMKLAAPHLSKFVENLGGAFEALAPAIGPLMAAFTAILDEIGPELPGLFSSISTSLIEMFDAVGENADTFALMFKAILMLVPPVIDVITWLINEISRNVEVWNAGKDAAVSAWNAVKNAWGQAGEFFSGLWDRISSGASSAKAAVMGVVGAVRRFVGKVVRIGQRGAQAAASAVSRLIGTIRRMVGRVVRVGVSGVSGAISAVSRLIGWIRRLTGKVVNVGVNIAGGVRDLLGFAHGGIVGAAGGGPRSNMVMVGEQGRELVRLPSGSTVIPNGQTEAMMAGGGGGAARLQIEWVGSNAGDEFMQWLRKNIRIRAGSGPDAVQRALVG